MNNTVVVYIYTDPAFEGDLAATTKVLKHRGFRVVKGDNPDELLFLLQVGRPAAVIYTLANSDSKTSASYQMVSRRAFDLLVPIVLVGPDDPRDGVLCIYPEGRKTVEKHLPYHSIADFISSMDENPPSTMSRPPEFVKKQTVGRGKTLLNWRGGEVSSVPPSPVNHDADDVTSDALVMPPSDFDETRPVPQEKMATDQAPKAETSAGGTGGKFKIVAIGLGAVTLVAIGVVVFLAMRPSVPAPKALPRISGPIIGSPIAKEPPIGPAPIVAVTPVTPPVAPIQPQPAEEDQVSKQRPKTRPPNAPPAVVVGAGDRMRFPGHFRDGTATFWFGGYEEEHSFLNTIRTQSAVGNIKIFGRVTIEELADRKTSLGLSRAWAVEKYLIRMGVDPDVIQTSTAAPVYARSDADEHGWARNRWVEISFD